MARRAGRAALREPVGEVGGRKRLLSRISRRALPSAVNALQPQGTSQRTSARPVTVLVSSAGRRVELVRGFRRAIASLGVGGLVVASDASWYSSAFHEADEGIIVPLLDAPDFVPALLEACEKWEVDLLVPTIDTEMATLAEIRQQFTDIGTTVLMPGSDVVRIAADKQLTHDWLVANGFPTVRQSIPAAVLADPAVWSFPLVTKPRFGSAGVGVAMPADAGELAAELGRPGRRETVVQSLARGHEYTIDVLADRSGRAVCAVPRRRIEVRAGEVSKGVTVRSRRLQDLAGEICSALPGAFGAINIQVFVDGDPDDPTAEMAVIEINARYGGGFPLALEAGADFPRWQLEDHLGLPSTAAADAWRDGLVMLRYDAAVFVDEAQNPVVRGTS
ncbi:ATP-grasp domain-containing protein [Mycolicibacterium mengxianglii]|uniref:ATP-grasp domain-containing protein n=1 Tax=Mycolicibacterium mengxianglii TaxID=2736649 RepID=UPI0035566F1C